MNPNAAAEHSARLSDLAPEVASTVVRVAGDIALVVGADGVIRSVADGPAPLHPGGQSWVGRAWADTVDASARQKVELLLHEAQSHGVSRRREFNHCSPEGNSIPVSWAAVRLGDSGPVLAVGRDLRAVSAIQQRFMDAQQEMERDYWQRRQTESHYRQLFQVAHDAVLVLDADSLEVLDANPAAGALLGAAPGELQGLHGMQLRHFIEAGLRSTLDELLVTARSSGRASEVRLRVAGSGAPIDLSATPFRADAQHCLLLRARRAGASAGEPQAVMDFIGQTPDAVVVADSAGRVLWANPAFVDLCEAASEARLKGKPLAEALGGEALQWATLLARVRSRGIVGQATVTLHPPSSSKPALRVGVSAALLADGDQEHIGFTLRAMPAVLAAVGTADELALDVAALARRVGQASLADLLTEAQRMAEVHFIQAALQACGSHIDATAALLQLPAPALLARMAQLGLPVLGSAGGAASGTAGSTSSTGTSALVN